jgi:anti-anti-sigma regulatory factor
VLRISVRRVEKMTTIQLEGDLVGPWVDELEACWAEVVAAEPHEAVVVDLTEVISIDEAGKELLARICRRGAEFVAEDCLMRSIVEEIEPGGEFLGANS